MRPPAETARIDEFLTRADLPATPFLVIDLEIVRDRYRRLRASLPQAEVWQGEVDAEGLTELLTELGSAPDVVVLDPPRAGAGAAVSRVLAGAGPRAVVYVACDPASLARDVAAFAAAGYRLTGLRGFDAFPMTAHVECVALLERRGG